MAKAILPSPIPVLQRGRWLKNTTPWREVTLFFFYAGCETLQKWLSDVKGTRPEHWESWFQPIADALVPYVEPLEDDLKGLTAEQEEKETWAGRNKNNKRALLAFAETNPAERLLMHVFLFAIFSPAERCLFGCSINGLDAARSCCLHQQGYCLQVSSPRSTPGHSRKQIVCGHWRPIRF